MTDWDEGTRPPLLPRRVKKFSKYKLPWTPRRNRCKYCSEPVKGWRVFGPVKKLCNKDGSIHICPSTSQIVDNVCSLIKSTPFVQRDSCLMAAPDAQLLDEFLVAEGAIWDFTNGRSESVRTDFDVSWDPSDYGIRVQGLINGMVRVHETHRVNSRPSKDIQFKYLLVPITLGPRRPYIATLPIHELKRYYSPQPIRTFRREDTSTPEPISTHIQDWEVFAKLDIRVPMDFIRAVGSDPSRLDQSLRNTNDLSMLREILLRSGLIRPITMHEMNTIDNGILSTRLRPEEMQPF